MRIVTWRALLWLMVLGVSAGQAQTIPVIHLSNTPWRYYQEGHEPTNAAQPGLSWKAPGFDDTTWSEGLGLFGFEDSPALPAPIQTPFWITPPGGSSQVITYYLRTRFNWTGGSNMFLWLTNLVDDGTVYYLNGVELYRLRITGTPTYASLAAGGPATEGAYEIVRLFTNRLLPGENNLAVELHQSAATSADIVFGLGMTAAIPDPVTITQQPPSQVDAIAGQDITLSVGASGSDLRHFWYRNGVFLTGQTNALLFINNITTNLAATYHVLVSNVISTARSSNVIVRVIPDTFGPRLLAATVLVPENNRIYVSLDEDLARYPNSSWSGTNVNNYVVTEAGTTNRLEVTQAVVGIGIQLIRLTLAQNIDRAKTYELCISNVADVRTNFIALNSCVAVGFEVLTNSFGFGSEWFFYDWLDAPPANWNQPDYVEDPGLWYEAPGMFYNQIGGQFNPPCARHSWILSLGPSAYYFRKAFTVPAEVVGLPVEAVLGRVMDDGAVFYLNGAEILRTNMPIGPVAHETRALAAGNPNLCATNLVAVGPLLRETNVLAVEVHQFLMSDLDAAFDGLLTLRYARVPVLTNRPPEGEVFLRYSNHSPTELRLYWTNGMGYALEQVNDLRSQWQEVQPPSTNVVVNKAGPARFYRLSKRH